MHHLSLLTLLCLISMLYETHCGKILVYPVDGSHWINMNVLIVELHSKGHNITVIRSSNSRHIKKESHYYTSITVEMGEFDKDSMTNLATDLLQMRKQERSFWDQIMHGAEILKKVAEFHKEICNMTEIIFENHTLMNSMQNDKYDVVLTDPAFGGGVLLAYRLGLPLIFNVRWTIHGEGHFAIAPSPLSYVPVTGAELTDKMTFVQRVKNVLIYFFTLYQNSKHTGPSYQAFCQKYFGPDVDYFSLFQKADIWLMRNDFIFEFPRPTMPNVIYMGGFQCRPSKPLKKDLEQFVQSSGDNGVIIMSLGTIFEKLSDDISEEVAAAFAQLPQKVIWRYTGPQPTTLGNNTILVDWIPQNDLLGHSKTKVFVAHGGTNGIQEAIYHGVPILGLPLAFDQPDNLSRMRERGTAIIVDVTDLNRTVFSEALKELLFNPSYRENMQKLSRLHRDQLIKPLDHAVFWIEYVMRHKGAPHLRTHSFRMSWIVYHSLDVILTLLGPILLTSFVSILVIRQIYCQKLNKKH